MAILLSSERPRLFPLLARTSSHTFAGCWRAPGNSSMEGIYLLVALPPSWIPGTPLGATWIAISPDSFTERLAIALPAFLVRTTSFIDLDDYFSELHALLMSAKPGVAASGDSLAVVVRPPPERCADLVSDLGAVATLLVSIAPSLEFCCFRPATLPEFVSNVECRVPPGYPAVPPLFRCRDLPCGSPELRTKWSTHHRFSAALAEINNTLSRFVPVWILLHHLDGTLRVQGPSDLSTTQRTISLGKLSLLTIQVDPDDPYGTLCTISVTKWRFSGLPSEVAALQRRLHAKAASLACKDPKSFIIHLESVLELAIPRKITSASVDLSGGTASNGICQICYSNPDDEEQINGEGTSAGTSMIGCQCGRSYHGDCLASAFRRSGKRQAFNFIFGECLFCCAILTVRSCA